ncbi:MAG TPA: methyltransferase domain-containing protein [Polyangiaceae bacterium]|nr:methyltransferase domain-containing protein [Polyangiaceae bacterium]
MKSAATGFSRWYPYNTIDNFIHLDGLLHGPYRAFLRLTDGRPVADIGAADGDLAFFLESIGVSAHVVDHAWTNFNRLAGARTLKTMLNSAVEIHDVDLDSQFRLPETGYGLVFLLGTLYHLKNPYYVLEQLARSSHWCILSTKVAKFSPDKTVRFAEAPVAYLLAPKECNDDATNYWVFSEAGLRRILDRTGWEVREWTTSNNPNSDPATAEGDERAFCLLESRGRR